MSYMIYASHINIGIYDHISSCLYVKYMTYMTYIMHINKNLHINTHINNDNIWPYMTI